MKEVEDQLQAVQVRWHARTMADLIDQKLWLLRRVDPRKHLGRSMRHPTPRPQNVCHLHLQLDFDPVAVQANRRAVLGHVQAKGFRPLVHWRGYGRAGIREWSLSVHTLTISVRGRVQLAGPRLRVHAVPGGWRRRRNLRARGRGRRGGGGVRKVLFGSSLCIDTKSSPRALRTPIVTTIPRIVSPLFRFVDPLITSHTFPLVESPRSELVFSGVFGKTACCSLDFWSGETAQVHASCDHQLAQSKQMMFIGRSEGIANVLWAISIPLSSLGGTYLIRVRGHVN